MKASTRRRWRSLRQDLRIARRFRIRDDGVAYELTVLNERKGHAVEVWRSSGNGLWQRIGSRRCGPTAREARRAAAPLTKGTSW